MASAPTDPAVAQQYPGIELAEFDNYTITVVVEQRSYTKITLITFEGDFTPESPAHYNEVRMGYILYNGEPIGKMYSGESIAYADAPLGSPIGVRCKIIAKLSGMPTGIDGIPIFYGKGDPYRSGTGDPGRYPRVKPYRERYKVVAPKAPDINAGLKLDE